MSPRREPRVPAGRLTDMGTFRGAWALVALVTAAAACAPRVQDDPDDPPTGPPAAGAARIVCVDEGTEVRTPTVGVRPDGVHLRVENDTDADRSIYVRRDGEILPLHHAPPGPSRAVSTQAPGTWEVACVRPVDYPDEETAWTRFRVTDPEDLWVSDRLDCENRTGTHIDYFRQPEGRPGDPVDLAAEDLPGEVPGWSPDHAIEPAGYPEAVPRMVRAVRDGEVVAVAEYPEGAEEGWYLGNVLYCEDEGPSEPEPSE